MNTNNKTKTPESNNTTTITRTATNGHGNKMKATIMVALFAALTSAGCFIQIPLPGGVPIVIQDMMAMLSGQIGRAHV